MVPVLLVDVNQQEAEKLVATLDPLSAMAQTDRGALRDLLARIQTEDAAVRDLLASRAPRAEAPQDAIPALPVSPVARFGQMWRPCVGQPPVRAPERKSLTEAAG